MHDLRLRRNKEDNREKPGYTRRRDDERRHVHVARSRMHGHVCKCTYGSGIAVGLELNHTCCLMSRLSFLSQINDDYYECLTPKTTIELLEACKKGKPPRMGRWGSLPMNGQVNRF